ncbi:MAG: HAMP domain-containing histidine kinase [Verrucomicrobia bacterium]|nr:HAMP domain-containing histidine kinase [Verrucomicrobiota bacterium]MCF7709511.1 HAMP domain-containing histidine kinase [Verrucomicrobiota bacterium]
MKIIKFRFPLYARILFWFFLNLLLLFVVFLFFFKFQFRFGLDAVLREYTRGQIRPVAGLIAEELDRSEREQWDAVLDRFGAAYDANLYLFRADGLQMAGANVDVPSEVRERFLSVSDSPARGMGRGGMGRGRYGTVAPGNTNIISDSSDRNAAGRGFGPGPPPGRGPRRFQDQNAVESSPKFMVRAGAPEQLWAAMPIRIDNESFVSSRPMLLLVAANPSAGGILFPNPLPWVIAGFGMVVISMIFWLPLVRSLTRSINKMNRTTGRIAAGELDARIEESRSDELGDLGVAINRMAARLEGFVTGQKRFLGDTAHELCSPIARAQMALGILENNVDETKTPYLEDIKEEVEQMSQLVNELLSFSKASLAGRNVRLVPVDLKEVVTESIEREARGKARVEMDVRDDTTVKADRALLLRAVSNVIRNSVRYAGDDGAIRISSRTTDNEVVLKISDSGPGLPEDALDGVFEPFFRVDYSRDRATGGVGLGLAIVKTCIESCNGTVSCRNIDPTGLGIEIRLESADV